MSVLRVEAGTIGVVPAYRKAHDWITSNGGASTGGASGGGDANPNDAGASRGDGDASPNGGRDASRGDARTHDRVRDPSALVRASDDPPRPR
jgi:hypothetical protein